MWVKICGINDALTAAWVAQLAPDAIGLNFYSGSPRRVDETTATKITDALPENVEAVGVFVDHSVSDIIRVCRDCGVPTAQLHGDYSLDDVDICREAGLQVIRVVRLRGQEWPAEMTAELELSETQNSDIRYLIDAQVPGAWGGTGQTVPWDLLKSQWRADWRPLILAGGLTPDNVHEAIGRTHSYGVDVASGVEISPGVKDRDKVQQFIHRARLAVSSTPDS